LLSSHLLEAIVSTAQSLSPASFAAVLALLDSERIGQNFVGSGRLADCVVLPKERNALQRLEMIWVQETAVSSAIVVMAALQSARAMSEEQKRAHYELVWTGPPSADNLRRTDQALQEVIQIARSELILVTFAVYRTPQLQTAIGDALERGVSIRFVSESPHSLSGKISTDPRTAWGNLADRMRFYHWAQEHRPMDAQGNTGSLHAKCAVADEAVVFISSANLTEHALALNMEMGLLIRGGTLPQKVSRHFHHLMSRNILDEIC